jgi:hypothetical protein
VRGIKTDEKDLCCTVARHKHTRVGGGGAVSGEEVTKVSYSSFLSVSQLHFTRFTLLLAARGNKNKQQVIAVRRHIEIHLRHLPLNKQPQETSMERRREPGSCRRCRRSKKKIRNKKNDAAERAHTYKQQQQQT